jgi:hypothetical protein
VKIIVCGGRNYADAEAVDAALGKLGRKYPVLFIAHGGAAGADSLAGAWAAKWGIPTEVYRADWNQHGRSAGPLRNQKMLDDFRPDGVVAFTGGAGTRHMVSIARAAGVPVWEVQ